MATTSASFASGLDISGSITISDFYAGNPERKDRWISMGIAEQSATAAAVGLAREGKLPVFGTYGTFAAARNLDQIRVSICYGNFNVLIAGRARRSFGRSGRRDPSGAGRSVCHVRAAEHVGGRCPAMRSRRARPPTTCCCEHVGPKYIRFAREATPIVTQEETPFVFGSGQRQPPAPGSAEDGGCFRDRAGDRIQGRGRGPQHHCLRSDGAGSDARGMDPEDRNSATRRA